MTESGASSEARGPLRGVRVLELAGLGPAPFGGMLLADLGADVIRIDRPTAEPQRRADGVRGEVTARGKRSISLDLKNPADLQLACALVDQADVLIDPYRPGVAERVGLGPDEMLERNPRLIYARMSGWGQEGPLSAAAGHDINYIALAGALHPMGARDRPPAPPLNLVGDYGGGGMLLAFGVASALFERERSDRGQVVDVAMVDGVATLLAVVCQLEAQGEWSREREANWLDGAAPWYRAYRTADDRFITVGALEPKFYRLLLGQLELTEEDWPQWDRDRWPELAARMEKIFSQRTMSEWCATLEGSDACFAPALRVDEAVGHPHLAARGSYVMYEGVLQPGPSPRFSRTPGAIQGPPPLPGQHAAEIADQVHLRPKAPDH